MSATTTTLRVRDVLGVRVADVPIGPGLTLIGGTNGAGKSSLLQAAAAVATGEPYVRGARIKKDLARLVHRGTDAGTATLDWGRGQRRVTWPSGALETIGDLRQFGTALGIGAERLMDMDAKARLHALTERLNLAPAKADLAEFLAEQGVGEEVVDALWSRIEVSGWDAVLKQAQDHAKRLQGRWEEASGERWGPQKSADWCPEGLLRGEPYNTEDEDRAVAAAQHALEQLRVADAVSDAQIRQAREAAAPLDQLRDEADKLQLASNAITADVAALNRRLSAMRPVPELGKPGPPPLLCPHCSGVVEVEQDPDTALVRIVAGKAPPPAGEPDPELEKRRAVHREIQAARTVAEDRMRRLQAEQRVIHARLGVAEEAAARLERFLAAPRVDDQALGEARLALQSAQTRREKVQALLRSRAIRAEWTANEPIVAALQPSGVRQRVLEAKIGAFNAELAELCALAKFPPVEVTADADVSIGGFSYGMASESERWRADLILTIAFARREGAAFVVVDRFDVLAPAARPGALNLLMNAGVPALVGVTVRDPDGLPAALKQMGHRLAWIEAGRLQVL